MLAREQLLRRLGWIVPLALAAVIAALPALGAVGPYRERQILLAAVYSMVVAGFNVSFGYGGQLALGQVAVFAGGAYTAAILHSQGTNELLVAMPVALAVSLVLGLITGLPGIRFSAWTLALVSFFLVVQIPSITNLWESKTGGVGGLSGILDPELAGTALSNNQFYVVTVVVAALMLLVYRNLVLSRFGQGLLVIKQGQALTQSLGMSPRRLRLSAYVLAAVPAGIAGVLYAYVAKFVQPNAYDFGLVTLLLAASLLGGTKSIWAAPVGSFLLVAGPDSTAAFERYSLLAYGVFLVVAGVGFSGGIAGLGNAALARALRRRSAPIAADGALPAVDLAEVPVDDELGQLVLEGEELRTVGVSKSFGGVRALDGVDFCARPGEITAIIGANGAGKTTLLNAISGIVAPDSGDVLLGSRSIAGLSPTSIARAGVSRTFQTPQVPESMSALDVAMTATYGREYVSSAAIAFRSPRYWHWRRSAIARAKSALAFVGLGDSAEIPATSLPLGRRRVLEIARCLTSRPSVLMLDEPAAGLDPAALSDLSGVLRRLRNDHATVVLIEHNVPFVMEVADTVFVMALGRVIASGPPDVVRADPEVIASYLGHRHGSSSPADEPALEADLV
ncbi:MAG TPA: branched-chain amino acid ABC transporter ATP-binding protein/permease [Ilumatobacteraceae bacterium]